MQIRVGGPDLQLNRGNSFFVVVELRDILHSVVNDRLHRVNTTMHYKYKKWGTGEMTASQVQVLAL